MSEKKQSTNANAGNPVLDALVELLQKIDESGAHAPKAVREAAQNLKDELPALSADGMKKRTIGEALQEGLNPKRQQTGRHDAKRLPAGYAFDGWSLMKPDGPGFGETVLTTEREQALAGSIISTVTGWADRGQLSAVTPKLEAMFEIASGFPFGARWRELLTSELEVRKRTLDEIRYRAKNGITRPPMRLPDPPVTDEARSGVDILAALRDEEGDDVPDTLTAEAIEKMAELVGSRGGKTARKIVDEFAAGIEPKNRE